MFKLIGIVAALILGGLGGRIYGNFMNRENYTINPTLCMICGLVGGGLGAWLVSTFSFGGGPKTTLLEIASGLGFACVLCIVLYFAKK